MKQIPICRFYTTIGYPDFKPKCLKRYKASKKCHEERKDCEGYEPSYTYDRRMK